MDFKDIIYDYIEQPYPLWESLVTDKLAEFQWKEDEILAFIRHENYSIAKCLDVNFHTLTNKLPIYNSNNNNENIYLEAPSKDLLSFYEKHGLNPCPENELDKEKAITKIKSAILLFDLVKPADECIKKLVRSICILKQENPEIDISYSHPKVPFSIFVSLCADNSPLSNLRVAESILHEAMHLKLSLIEKVKPLIKSSANNLFFSPWREEKRPAQGILHGLFVFRAIYDFYLNISHQHKYDDDDHVLKFLTYRLEDIRSEINSINDFFANPDLLPEGKILATRLLQF